jgi:hypothetical protein
MKKHYDKIMTVMVLGSIWGVFEIYGVRVLQAMAVPHKSPFLFAFAILIMIASKKLSSFPGSAVVMALIAALYKTFSFSLPACGSNAFVAIMIDGAVFEIGYLVTKISLETSLWRRSALGSVFALSAFLLFGLFATYISPENAVSGGNFTSLLKYLKSSGIYAAVLAIFAINIGMALGNFMRKLSSVDYSPKAATFSKIAGLVSLVAAWSARIVTNM